MFVEAVKTRVVGLGGANRLHLVLFGAISPADLEVGKICEAERTLPKMFFVSHLLLVQ